LFYFLDKPGPPKDLAVTDVTERTCALKWNEPDSDGGSDITSYHVEVREANRRSWNRVGTLEAHERKTFTVSSLTEGTAYQFRVAAENACGVGEFAELSQSVVPKSKFGKNVYCIFKLDVREVINHYNSFTHTLSS